MERRMSGGRRFDASEIRVPGENDPTVAELASALAAARELEVLDTSDGIRPTDGFEDRVMAAVATQPAPRVAVRPGSAVRGGPVAAFLIAVRDAWGVASTGGRPFAVRAQALAFVLLVLVAVGSLAGAGAVTVGGLLSQHQTPAPSVGPDQTVGPTPIGTPLPSPTPTMTGGPTSSPEVTETPGPGETGLPGGTSNPGGPGETPKPGETARPTSTPRPGQTPRPTQTPRATETPRPTETPDPGDTPEPSDDHGSDGSGSGGPGPG
jgi:hypothetical protein